MRGTFCNLSDVATLVSGHPFRGSLHDEPAGGVLVMSMAQGVADALTASVALPQIDFAGDIAKLQLAPGDVLFRSRGVSNLSIYVDSVQQPCIFAAPLVRIRVNDPQKLEPRYLHWVLNSPAVQRDIHAQARGSMIRMVSLPSLRSLQIPVPPVSVQRNIAEVARLLREERALSEALVEKNKTHADQILWAKAQSVTTP